MSGGFGGIGGFHADHCRALFAVVLLTEGMTGAAVEQ